MVTQNNARERLLGFLGAATREAGRATVLEMAEALGASQQNVRRLLADLEQRGLVEFAGMDRRSRAYRLVRDPRPPQDPPIAAPGALADPPAAASPSPAAAPRTPVPARTGTSFESHDLDRMVIALPLQNLLVEWEKAVAEGAQGNDPRLVSVMERARVNDAGYFTVIVDLNVEYPGGVARARQRVLDLLAFVALGEPTRADGHSRLEVLAPRGLRDISSQYLVVRLRPQQVRALIRLDRATFHPRAVGEREGEPRRAVHRIWPDNIVQRQTVGSIATIKADAARSSFGCTGRGIVWAVVDSGIDAQHPHFAKYRNLEDLPSGVSHQDFVALDDPKPLIDRFGHGTHVAGIIAGGCSTKDGQQPVATMYERNESGGRVESQTKFDEILGVAPECKLVSLKVLDDRGKGGVTEVMAALEQVLRTNGYGKTILVHGVNLSLGYVYDPQWFACGHSPLCEVVNRLARSGVCVVAAAGNSGYGDMDTKFTFTRAQGMSMSINDPGNAERALTVGSTHREAPHTYGVSYFSSKGPTGDGRSKPDLLAPGEKIISCRANAPPDQAGVAQYIEDSGTSMAAPHVSGAIAALLSARREFIGQSDEVKKILMDSALDLGRDRSMQGSGVLNLFSALQSI